ncbi:MAG TPA: hypothetical protein VGS80_21300, partial [Ktedonobacterales bacterium]|nr:hypothetical protein [Ktedonobacterales bacterium]
MTARLPDLAADARLLAVSEAGTLSRAVFWQRVRGLERALAKHPARRWALVCEDSGWFAAGFLALANVGRELVLPQAPQAGSLSASGAAVDAVLTDKPQDFQGFAVLGTEDTPVDGGAAPRLPDDA